MIKSFFIPIFEKGRRNAAHTRYTRPHRQGRAQAQEKGGADEEEIPQEADRHRETVRRLYYDTTEIKVLPRYLCRSDSEIRATKGYKRLEDSSQVHAAVLSDIQKLADNLKAEVVDLQLQKETEQEELRRAKKEIQTATLVKGKPLEYTGELYSEEHGRKFTTKKAGFQVLKAPTDGTRLVLAID